MPCAGFTFSAVAKGNVSETITRVFALTANQNSYFLMAAKFSSETMNASGSYATIQSTATR